MSEWIECKDRMPPAGEEVNIAFETGRGKMVSSAAYGWSYKAGACQEWHSIDDADETYGHLNITHWQPLPEPPK